MAYKLVEALYEEYGIAREEWLDMLEFAAIATVGDVMRLQDENRIIVKIRAPQDGRNEESGA